MILAVDVGNTNIVLGCIGEGGTLFVARIATDHFKTEDQYAAEIKGILTLYSINIANIEGAIISSVVPPLSNLLQTAIHKIIEKTSLIVGPGLKTGLHILIDNPAQLGSDLVVNAVAAIDEYTPPYIIIDMGTATTISVLDEKCKYLGGCIMPGVKISLDALSSRTSQLPGISLETPKKTVGKNTIDCMRSGVILGSASMLDGIIERISEEQDFIPTIIATGGLSKFIIPHCKHQIIYDENLLLKGLYLIYKKNA